MFQPISDFKMKSTREILLKQGTYSFSFLTFLLPDLNYSF